MPHRQHLFERRSGRFAGTQKYEQGEVGPSWLAKKRLLDAVNRGGREMLLCNERRSSLGGDLVAERLDAVAELSFNIYIAKDIRADVSIVWSRCEND